MSKEYTQALERLYCSGNLQLDYVLSNKHKQDYEIVEKALQRLEAIDNAKPSEALEYVENIQSEIEWALEFNNKKIEDYDLEYFDIIKQALIKAEQDSVWVIAEEYNLQVPQVREAFLIFNLLKGYPAAKIRDAVDKLDKKSKKELAFEIIKEKNIDTKLLRECNSVDEYNTKIKKDYNSFHYKKYRLTQEEFDLLRQLTNRKG